MNFRPSSARRIGVGSLFSPFRAWGRAGPAALQFCFLQAFPPHHCVVGAWLSQLPPALLDPWPAEPDPDPPISKRGALREGALLYEVVGEPRSGTHVA
jgi:hypothetical protein